MPWLGTSATSTFYPNSDMGLLIHILILLVIIVAIIVVIRALLGNRVP